MSWNAFFTHTSSKPHTSLVSLQCSEVPGPIAMNKEQFLVFKSLQSCSGTQTDQQAVGWVLAQGHSQGGLWLLLWKVGVGGKVSKGLPKYSLQSHSSPDSQVKANLWMSLSVTKWGQEGSIRKTFLWVMFYHLLVLATVHICSKWLKLDRKFSSKLAKIP